MGSSPKRRLSTVAATAASGPEIKKHRSSSNRNGMKGETKIDSTTESTISVEAVDSVPAKNTTVNPTASTFNSSLKGKQKNSSPGGEKEKERMHVNNKNNAGSQAEVFVRPSLEFKNLKMKKINCSSEDKVTDRVANKHKPFAKNDNKRGVGKTGTKKLKKLTEDEVDLGVEDDGDDGWCKQNAEEFKVNAGSRTVPRQKAAVPLTTASCDEPGESVGECNQNELSADSGLDISATTPSKSLSTKKCKNAKSKHEPSTAASMSSHQVIDYDKVARLKSGIPSFEEMGSMGAFIPETLISGLRRKGFIQPTPIQLYAIPKILSGADCLIKAPTAMGKSFAFGIPIIAMLMQYHQMGDSPLLKPTEILSEPFGWRKGIQAMILVPSKELVTQLADVFNSLCFHCFHQISLWAFPECPKDISTIRFNYHTLPNLMITQPGALYKLCRGLFYKVLRHGNSPDGTVQGRKQLNSKKEPIVFWPALRHLVVDEADLILSTFGFEEETAELFKPQAKKWEGRNVIIVPIAKTTVSHRAQIVLSSATLNEEVTRLSEMALYKPELIAVNIREEQQLAEDINVDDLVKSNMSASTVIEVPQGSQATTGIANIQHRFFSINRKDFHDYIALYCVLKFKWAQPKTIVFAESPFQVYQLQIFLTHFGFKSVCVSPTQTLRLRLSNIRKFNQSLFEVLVGCDGSFDGLLTDEEATGISNSQESTAASEKPSKKQFNKRGTLSKKEDAASMISRGIDFQGVYSIIHFACPKDETDYLHRAGRAARGSGLLGQSLVMANSKEGSSDQEFLTHEMRTKYQFREVSEFDDTALTAYKYRVTNCCKGLTPSAVKQLQLNELKEELQCGKDLTEVELSLIKSMSGFRRNINILKSRAPAYVPSYLKQHGVQPG